VRLRVTVRPRVEFQIRVRARVRVVEEGHCPGVSKQIYVRANAAAC